MIDVSDLTVDYGNKAVINRLSFSVHPNDGPLVLAGRNGSGKSTFFKALLGSVPYTGKIKRPASIAWMPQQNRIAFRLPVLDFIALGSAQSGSGLFPNIPSDARTRAIGLLEEYQLGHLQHAWTDALSGGEWQLICLIQMSMQNAGIWLLDEPSSSLDIFYKNLIFKKLWEQQEKGIQVVVSTHDLPFLPERPGKLLLFGPEPSLVSLSSESLRQALSFLSSRG